MLLGQVEISVSDFAWQHKAVVFHAAGRPQLLESLRT